MRPWLGLWQGTDLDMPSSPIPKLRLAASSLLALVGDIGSESAIACYNENAFDGAL